MSYSLRFARSAHKEWQRLDPGLRKQFAAKLAERLHGPRVEADALRKMPGCYKIKLRSAGYRLVYRVEDGIVTVIVLAVGKREADKVYLAAARALNTLD